MNDINEKEMKMVEPRITPLAADERRRAVVDLDRLVEDLHQQPKTAALMSTRMRTPNEVARLEPDHDMERELGTAVEKSITDLGRLSAEAIMHKWEATATSAASLGEDIKAMIGKLRDEMARCDANLKRLAETIAEIREAGKMSHALVERSSQLSDDVQATCEGLSKKLKA
jgi:chromosome segregation ATPase